jgi:hypothetical protein
VIEIDWQAIFQDTALIAGVSTAICFIIDFIKKLYYKIQWKWVQNTPGEVWFAISIALGLAVALVVLWPILVSGEGSFFDKFTTTIYGLVFGAGSKLVHSVSSSAGAKLQSFKLEQKAKSDALTQGAGYIKPGTGADALSNVSTPIIVEQECATPVIPEATIIQPSTIEKRIEETKKKLTEQIEENEIYLIRKLDNSASFILVGGKKVDVSMEMAEVKK